MPRSFHFDGIRHNILASGLFSDVRQGALTRIALESFNDKFQAGAWKLLFAVG